MGDWYEARDRLLYKYGHVCDAMQASLDSGRSEFYEDEREFLMMPKPLRQIKREMYENFAAVILNFVLIPLCVYFLVFY